MHLLSLLIATGRTRECADTLEDTPQKLLPEAVFSGGRVLDDRDTSSLLPLSLMLNKASYRGISDHRMKDHWKVMIQLLWST